MYKKFMILPLLFLVLTLSAFTFNENVMDIEETDTRIYGHYITTVGAELGSQAITNIEPLNFFEDEIHYYINGFHVVYIKDGEIFSDNEIIQANSELHTVGDETSFLVKNDTTTMWNHNADNEIHVQEDRIFDFADYLLNTQEGDTNTYTLASEEIEMPPNPTLIIDQIMLWFSAIVSGFIGLFAFLFASDGVLRIIYTTTDGLTIFGGVLLIPIGYFLVTWAFSWIRGLLQLKG